MKFFKYLPTANKIEFSVFPPLNEGQLNKKVCISFGIGSENAQFFRNCLKIIRPSVSFYKDVWCERTTL